MAGRFQPAERPRQPPSGYAIDLSTPAPEISPSLSERWRALIGLPGACLVVPVLYAQAPSAAWRTLETVHFRVHYTPEYAEFATHVASQMESIRRDVSSEVGYTSGQTVDVVVRNPFSQLNGEAITPLSWPRIVLWAYPPEADGELGSFSDWGCAGHGSRGVSHRAHAATLPESPPAIPDAFESD